ncbi:putative oxidoreductase [Xenorhabdus poinarii G6]|uniref:Putative oxidoreductase n=1 Tax=Xenorhabdus poinarii G6 TaxID=1354304 RepID=A0A068R3M1_9GAMM|nr:NAD(P)H-dependent oxidoreductase [Xenorhabdus poinarii]CDG21526.1 putative oxidoreductase [Xenorhabdus poinarii G6]
MNNYVIVSSSTRENSQSIRVAHTIKKLLSNIDNDANIELIDLAIIHHQEWSNEFWKEAIPCPAWRETSRKLTYCNAIIFVVPEWHGMIPPALMNFLVLIERNELAHKPALIVSISSGNGGTYPIVMLKGFCSKNNRICFIPDHIVVRHVSDITFENDLDCDVSARLCYSLGMLKAYIPALELVRQNAVLDYETWPYGM